MKQPFTVTLSRAHKISERMAAQIGELRKQSTELAKHIAVQGYAPEQLALIANNGTKAMALLTQQERMAAAHAAVRAAIGRANASSKINELLARIEANKKVLQGVEALLALRMTAANVPPASVQSFFATTKEGSLVRQHASIAPLTAQAGDELQAKKAEIERENFTLSDELSDLNAQKINLEIDEEFVPLLGLA